MIFERTPIYSLESPYSIYSRMAVSSFWDLGSHCKLQDGSVSLGRSRRPGRCGSRVRFTGLIGAPCKGDPVTPKTPVGEPSLSR